jgi:hypothetical protein
MGFETGLKSLASEYKCRRNYGDRNDEVESRERM